MTSRILRSMAKTIAFALFSAAFVFNAPLFAQEELVFDFESGDFAQTGWIVAEGECGKPLGSRDKTFHYDKPYPKRGDWYLTTLESTESERTYESNECVLESPVFVLSSPFLKFCVGGGDIAEVWLEICLMNEDGSIKPLMNYKGKRDQTIDEYEADLTRYLGRPLLIRVVDKAQGAWSYLHADDFRGQGRVDEEATKTRRAYLTTTRANEERKIFLNRLSALETRLEFFEANDALRERYETLRASLANAEPEIFLAKQKEWSDELFRIERAAALTSALFEDRPILYVSRGQYPYEHHNTETTYQTDDICVHLMPTSGSSLKIWFPQTDETYVLLNVPEGLVRDPCLSFDAERLICSIRWNREDDFHLYEIDLKDRDLTREIAREDVRQLTFGQGVSDIGPQYLPNGKVVFSSTREPKYCMCNRHIMHNLFTMNADGSNLLQIGHSTLFEGDASILPDGRILYFRWEYVDRQFADAEGAWTVNPDGTNHALYWGNNTESPAANLDPRSMPSGDGLFVCTMTGCHTSPWGAIGLIDRKKGLDDKAPVLKTWPSEAMDLIGTHTGRSWDALLKLSRFYEDPFPLEDDAIVAAGTLSNAAAPSDFALTGTTALWLLTVDDGEPILLHTDPVGCFDPTPLAPTIEPPIVPDRVDLSRDSGEFYVVDVNQGFGMENVPRGSAKYLRVVEAPEKRFWTYPSWEGVANHGDQQAPAMNWDDFGNKRILGIVPIESDGSVYVTVPCDKFVFFQLLDENMEMIQSMRSGVALRPGETNGCFGCHEDRLEAFPSNANTIATQKEPQQLQLQFGREPFLFSYAQEIQPIWDKYCVACHDALQKDASEIAKRASAKVNLCGDLNPVFNDSYWDLRAKKLVDAIGSAYAPKQPPLSWGARSSKIVKILREGHDAGGPIDSERAKLGLDKITKEEIELVATWIDLNAPYYPDFSTGYPNGPYGRSPLSFDETRELLELTGCVLPNHELDDAQLAGRLLDPRVSFSRPELSPCLDRWNDEEKDSDGYRRALQLITLGQERLKANPREDMQGWKLVNPIELRREAKYEALRAKSKRMQDAEMKGEKLFDKDDQPQYERCMM